MDDENDVPSSGLFSVSGLTVLQVIIVDLMLMVIIIMYTVHGYCYMETLCSKGGGWIRR